MKAGEEKAWDVLSGLDPDDVCRRSSADYDQGSGSYSLDLYGFPVTVDPAERSITGNGPQLDLLLGRLSYFSCLSTVNFLMTAKDVPPSGHLVKPADMRSHDIYYKGSHVLPLPVVAGRYGSEPAAFAERGKEFNGTPADYGDASVLLTPFPRMELVLVLWAADDEFPARADLLFDSNCELHAADDIIWAIAMMTVLLML